MPITALYVRHRRPKDYGATPGSTTITRRAGELYRRVLNVFTGSLGGANDADYTFVGGGTTEPAFACGALLLSGASGVIGGIINGVTLTATHGTTDILDAALIAAVINASSNALVQGFLTSNNLGATLTLTNVLAGDTVDICGYRFTAVAALPTVNRISGYDLGNFSVAGSDTADALTLATAINQRPGLSRYGAAISVAGVVHLMARQYAFASPTFSWPTGPGVPANNILSNAATIVASGASFITSAKVNLLCCVPGVFGNAVTVALSGTGVTVLGTQTRLIGGTGLDSVSIVEAA